MKIHSIQEYTNFIYLDDQTGPSDPAVFPNYDTLIGVSALTTTTMACWTRKS
ncbi:MAG: hypothetical protein R3A12_09940 [Ignavibacteria bacterium]